MAKEVAMLPTNNNPNSKILGNTSGIVTIMESAEAYQATRHRTGEQMAHPLHRLTRDTSLQETLT